MRQQPQVVLGEVKIVFQEEFFHGENGKILERATLGKWLSHHPWRYIKDVDVVLRDMV